jgi:diguanylate cyclase (GGDEF)-like protein
LPFSSRIAVLRNNVLIPKVLLVNDDTASLLALTSLLTYGELAKEYEVVTASSGEEALREVLKNEFAVILLDVNMPGMDGFETAEAIHSHPRSASVPIIFITAYLADEISRLKGYQKGAVDYLFTPVIPKILQAKIAVFVDLAKKNLELQKKTIQLEALNQDLQVQRLQDLERINSALEVEIIERRQAEQRAHELATCDSLTKLPNRRSLIDRLEHAITHASRHDERLALLFLDLDKFKQINDTLGHEVGDMLLIQVGARLSAAVRESDMVARLGGDEFVVLLVGLSGDDDAARVANKIIESIALPFDLGRNEVRTSTSIGISLFPQDGMSAQEMLKNADLAMYHAKQNQRGTIQFFHEELNARMQERVRFEQELQQAVEKEQLTLHFQPKVDIDSGQMTGMEALLRWDHPRYGMIAADQFISIVEDRRLLVPLLEWVIAAVCQQVRRWRDADEAILCVPVAVNVATSQLQPELPETVQAILRSFNLPASVLQLEIGEPALIREFAKIAPVLAGLSAVGITVAIDDFGTGYSSLSLLKSLPVGILKLDRCLVGDLGKDQADTAIVAAAISTARALSLRVVAEGVETEQQLSVLRNMGCDEYQGYLFSKALPADLLMQKMTEQRILPSGHYHAGCNPAL